MSTAEEVSKRGMAEGPWEDGLSTTARQATGQDLHNAQGMIGIHQETSRDETPRNRYL